MLQPEDSAATEQDLYLLFQGLEGLKKLDLYTEIYKSRLYTEWKVVMELGFSNYYLVVQDFVQWAKDQGISVGPARGSGGGSLLAYAVSITEVDPIKYDLVFERFLNKGRLSLPDFDIDYCMKRRSEVISYIKVKYGEDQVVSIGTKGTMKAKLAVRDTARCLGLDPETVDRFGKLIPDEARGGQGNHAVTLPKCIRPTQEFIESHRDSIEKFQSNYDTNSSFKNCINRAAEIEGLPKSTGVHAAGIIIWDQPITNIVPLMRAKDGSLSTQWVDKEVEKVGLVKYDFLGLRTLTVIAEAEESVARRFGTKINWKEIPEDDSPSFTLLSSGDCLGVFQLTDKGIAEFTRKFKPESIEDIATISALYRPGPLDSGMCDEILEIRSGSKDPHYPISSIKEIMQPTSGVLTFQEQVLAIAQVMAGYSLSDADLLRRAMGKKIPEEMAQNKARFITGAVSLGHDEISAEGVFTKIEKFADYGFNKSHAIGYSILSYRTAYLKANYRSDFYAACMSSYDDQDKIRPYLVEAQRSGIKITLPDVNESEANFTAVSDTVIRFGLTAIRGCGNSAVNEIIRARKDGHFKSIVDFCYRVDPNVLRSNNLEALSISGALNSLEPLLNRLEISAYSKSVALALSKDRRDKKNNQTSLFDSLYKDESRGITVTKPQISIDKDQLLAEERESLGFYISRHPLDSFENLRLSYHFDDIASIEMADLRVTILGMIQSPVIKTTKKGTKYCACLVEDKTGIISVKVWSNKLKQCQDLLKEGEVVLLRGKTSEFNGIEVSADSISKAPSQLTSSNFRLNISKLNQDLIAAISAFPKGSIPVDLEVDSFRYRLGRFNLCSDSENFLMKSGAIKEDLNG
jgi:DNA polymerase III subunit alpha